MIPLAAELRRETTSGPTVFRFEDYAEVAGVLIARRMTMQVASLKNRVEVRASRAPGPTASERRFNLA